MSEAKHKSESGSRGVDSPRRRWSEAERRRIVARRHGVHTSLLFKWRRRYRTAPETGAGFVPVVVDGPEPASGRMEIVLGEEVRVVVDATVHAGALARVLAVVGRR